MFQDAYGLETAGLRYFNVVGPRQDPNGPYAAVILRWVLGLLRGEPCKIYGDGQTSRDFCYVENAVQANLLAATAPAGSAHLQRGVRGLHALERALRSPLRGGRGLPPRGPAGGRGAKGLPQGRRP